HGSANVHLLVLPRLTELLGASSLAARGRRPLTPLLEAAAVRAVAAEAQGPLEAVRQHPALHQTLRSTFRELRHAAEEGLSGLAAQGELRSEVVRLYRLFRERTDLHYYDREALARAAAQAVRDGAASGLKDLGPVVFFLVSDLTPGELALVEALGEHWSCAVVLGITGDTVADGPVRALAERLDSFQGPLQEGPVPQLPPISRLVITPDPQQEVRWVLRHLMRAAQEGVPFHRMAVLYRQPTPYAALVQEELSLSEVPMAGPGNVPLAETAAGRTLVGLVRLVGSDFPRSEVMAWLTGCPVVAPEAPRQSIQPSHWDAISRKAGVVGGLAQWQQRLERYAAEMERLAEEGLGREDVSEARAARMREEAAAARALMGFIAGMADRLQTPPDGSAWAEFARWAQDLLTAYRDRTTARSREAEDEALHRIEETLKELRTLDEVEPRPSFEGFRLALEEALATPLGHLGQTGRGVFVAPLGTALGMSFELVCVVGMVEGVVPPHQPDDPLLPDRERQRAGGPEAGIPLRAVRDADERYRYLAALAAAERCVLSFPRGNPGAQRGQFPSRWFLEAATRLYGAPVYTSNLWSLGPVTWLTVVASMEDGLRTVTTEAPADVHDRDLHHLWRWRRAGKPVEEHHLAALGHLASALALEQGRAARQLTPWDGDVSVLKDRARRLRLLDRPALSATSLEAWATCPFRYLLGHVLGVAALEQPEEVATISPWEKGSLVHGVLERFIRTVQEQGGLPSPGEPWRQEHWDLLHHMAHQAFAEAEARGVTGKALLWGLEQEAILSDLEAFLAADAALRARFGMTPHLVEVRFGLQGPTDGEPGLPPAEREIPGVGTLRFRGVVDRVDLAPSSKVALVLDYKTGGTSSYEALKKDPVDAGRRLQLPIYTLALQKGLGEGVTVRAAYWFVSTRGKFAILPPEPVELVQVAERFDAAVGTIAQGIAGGVFPSNPGPEDRGGFTNCTWCDFDTLCPSRRDVLWERKQTDPRLKAYLGLQAEEGGGE
ncbi:MAG: PD-(D/E)XK nuclease family protein, partial [Dehalococcoidia bacterium]|nr:PD-(D/E)XK nuclease family protein [Dehalococcoidia bacterium]